MVAAILPLTGAYGAVVGGGSAATPAFGGGVHPGSAVLCAGAEPRFPAVPWRCVEVACDFARLTDAAVDADVARARPAGAVDVGWATT
jgi:hypothetical protein